MHVPWKEYWKFVGDYADFTTPDGLSKLEEYLRQLKEKADPMEAKNDVTGIPGGEILLAVSGLHNYFIATII